MVSVSQISEEQLRVKTTAEMQYFQKHLLAVHFLGANIGVF